MKRQRGRGRKPGGGGNQSSRALESNGPDTKVRGTAAFIYERYLQLARDATSAGDRVIAENYLQHAEHYFRIFRASQPAMPIMPMNDRHASDREDFDEASASGGSNGAEQDHQNEAHEGEDAEQAFSTGEEQSSDGEFRRNRRGRRGRYRQNGEGERQSRPEGDGEHARRPPRVRASADDHGDGGEEGFSSGPTPAFLASD